MIINMIEATERHLPRQLVHDVDSYEMERKLILLLKKATVLVEKFLASVYCVRLQ